MWRKYRDHGVVILGVATHGQSPEVVRNWLTAHPVSFPILIDEQRQYYDAYLRFTGNGVHAPFPRHVVIGPDGRVLAGMASYRPDLLATLFERSGGAAP